ncbi:hypothetical protein HAX54_041758, partial [Datura stramonium]|nr:hypothetical protein [Datura stramonium]
VLTSVLMRSSGTKKVNLRMREHSQEPDLLDVMQNEISDHPQGLVPKGYKYQGSHPINNILINLNSGITTRSGL